MKPKTLKLLNDLDSVINQINKCTELFALHIEEIHKGNDFMARFYDAAAADERQKLFKLSEEVNGRI
jgi:hypothetical protein